MILRVAGKLLYASSLIVTVPILGLGVLTLVSLLDRISSSIEVLVFAGWVVGGVLGVAGLILGRNRRHSWSRLRTVVTVACLLAGTTVCGSIAIMLLSSSLTPFAALPFVVLAVVGIRKMGAILRARNGLDETVAIPSELRSAEPASTDAQPGRLVSDPAPSLLLGVACLLAIVAFAMHLVLAL